MHPHQVSVPLYSSAIHRKPNTSNCFLHRRSQLISPQALKSLKGDLQLLYKFFISMNRIYKQQLPISRPNSVVLMVALQSNFVGVVSTLLNFVRMFGRAHEENCKKIELDKKRAQKEAENEKMRSGGANKEPESLQIELERKKSQKEAENGKMKTGGPKKEPENLQIELERKRLQKEAENEKMKIAGAKKEPERLLRTPIESGNIK